MKITNKTTKFIEKSLKICKDNSLTLIMFSFKRYIKSNEDSLVMMMVKVKLHAGEKAYLFLVWYNISKTHLLLNQILYPFKSHCTIY